MFSSPDSSNTLRRLLRIMLGGLLGMLMGTEMYVYGFAVFTNPTVLIPLIILYIFLFVLADDFIVRFQLKDRDLFFLGAALGLIVDGIANQLFYETEPAAGFITFLGINIGSLILDLLAWGIYYVWIMHLMNRILPRQGNTSLLGLKGWVGIGLVVALLVIQYLSSGFKQEHIFTDLLLLFLAITVSFYLRFRVKHRKEDSVEVVEHSNFLNFLSTGFIMIGFIATVFGLQNALPIPLHLILAFLFFFPSTLLLLRKQRVAV